MVVAVAGSTGETVITVIRPTAGMVVTDRRSPGALCLMKAARVPGQGLKLPSVTCWTERRKKMCSRYTFVVYF